VLIHQDVASNERQPWARRLTQFNKHIFSPLKLETMFEPPPTDNKLQPPVLEKALPAVGENHTSFHFDDPKSMSGYQFTFYQPHKRTPLPNIADNTPSKLRMFQFQYDTYTRDHLSALIDSIAINSSSNTTPNQCSEGDHEPEENFAFRPTKRLKLSSPAGKSGPRRHLPHSKRSPRARNSQLSDSRSFTHAVQTSRASNPSAPTHRSTASSTVNATESLIADHVEKLGHELSQSVIVAEADVWKEQGSESVVGSRKSSATMQPMIRNDVNPSRTHSAQPRFPSNITNITRIGPTDISPVPEQIGKMQYDKGAFRWIKRVGEESEDPFYDIESGDHAGQSDRPHSTRKETDHSRIDDQCPSAPPLVPIISLTDGDKSILPIAISRPLLTVPSTPLGTPGRITSRANPTPIRSALRTTPLAQKNPDPTWSSGKPRSVSFSDGRLSGRIRGLHPREPDEETTESEIVITSIANSRSLQPSLRTRRIGDMLDDLDETSRESVSILSVHHTHFLL
jgi:hypothetical protein